MADLYSNLKIFYFNSKLKDISERVLSAPIHIRLKPTNRCNHRCYYCCYRNKNLYVNQLFDEKEEIPLKKMHEIINDFKRLGVKAVTFSGGGEPLCYLNIIGTIENLLRGGIKIGMLTNGSLLKGEVAHILSREATWVRISMDAADSQTYTKIRSVSIKEFDSVCKNIYNFTKIKSKKCELGVNFVVTRENFNDIFKFLKLMKRIGVDNAKISESVVSTEKEENRKYWRPILNSVKRQIAKGISHLADSNFAIIDKFDKFDDGIDSYHKRYTQCPFIQCLTVIAADMNVYTCYDKAYTKEGKIGSIKDMNFRKMWLSNEVQKKLWHLDPSKVCNHHCAQHTKNLLLLDYLNVNREHLEFV